MNTKKIIVAAALMASVMLHSGGTALLVAQSPLKTGITVHGDWTIEIRTAGGALVNRRTFSNHLSPEGATLLSSILTRTTTPTGWVVEIGGPGCAASPAGSCRFTETREGDGKLTVSLFEPPNASGGGTLPARIILSGANTATAAGDVDHVLTRIITNPVSVYDLLTRANLQTDIPVSEGQIIQLKVEISFSSGG
jgi:hypothetical protein